MEITQRTVKPLAIKESQHRWYLIAEDNKDGKIKNFGFDRISDLKFTDTKFKPIKADIEKIYQNAFGIEKYAPVEKIVLEFSWQQGNYIKSFPLHTSQKIIENTEDKLVVELLMHTTNDVVMELMKYGAEVKVIEPKSLKNMIKDRITNMTELYK